MLARRQVWTLSMLGALAFGSTTVSAQDRWSRPHPGVMHLHRRLPGQDFHVVEIDMATPGLRVVTTAEDELAPRHEGAPHRWETTSHFARRHDLAIAVNANYYDIFHGAMTACGLAMSEGRAFASSYIDRRLGCWDSVGFGRGGQVGFFDSHGHTFGPAPAHWITEVVTGSPRVLRGGAVVEAMHPRHARSRNPRTVLGASADRRRLFLLLVNGREGHGLGMTTAEAGRVLVQFGAWDAVNLDGGGSSTLYVREEGGVVSRFADRTERPVATHLGFAFDGPVEAPVLELADAHVTAPQSLVATRRRPVTVRPARPQVERAALGGKAGVVGVLGMLALAIRRRARCRDPRTPSRGSRP